MSSKTSDFSLIVNLQESVVYFRHPPSVQFYPKHS